MNLFLDAATYRSDCIKAENRAELAEEELACVKAELQAAHRTLDAHVGRTVEYKGLGRRLLALCERIDVLSDAANENDRKGWEKYWEQLRANEALVANIKALRASFDRLEAENLKLSRRVAGVKEGQ